MTLEQVRALKRAAIAARPVYHDAGLGSEAEELWGQFYDSLYRLETRVMQEEQDKMIAERRKEEN